MRAPKQERNSTKASLGNNPATIADPKNRQKTFSWRLTETRDSFGNRITYDYVRDLGEDGPHQFDQLYLSRIQYVDFLFSISFENEDQPDPFSEYRSGFEIRTRKRCRRIRVQVHAGTDQLVRTYHLSYADDPDLELQNVAVNGASLLNEIWLQGHDQSHPNLLINAGFATAGAAGPTAQHQQRFGNNVPISLTPSAVTEPSTPGHQSRHHSHVSSFETCWSGSIAIDAI